MDDLWQRLIEKWRKGGGSAQAGVQQSEVEEFETRHGIKLPADIRAYFQAVNGTGRAINDDMFRFWQLSEVKRVGDWLDIGQDKFSDCFVFADFCIDCWGYGVCISGDSEESESVFRITGSDPPGEYVAGSFREFMELYIADSDSVL
jgi:hypothetical protein